MSGDTPSRRDFLSVIGASGIIGLSGCGEAAEDPTSTSGVADTVSHTPSPSATPTTVDDVAPSIVEHEALPDEYGTKLNVLLRGEDNRQIAYAAISYGNRNLETEPGEPEVELDGVLEEIPDAEPTFPGQVVYSLRDEAGNETEITAYADERAPTLSLSLESSENAGELELTLEGRDEVGLHELRTELNGEPALTENVTGQREISLQKTVAADINDSINPGETNNVAAELEDAMGNTSRQRTEQYVRKYNRMADSRMNLCIEYIADFPLRPHCWNQRKPAIGTFDDQYPSWVFNRHLDQFSGFGIDRVMVQYIGSEETARESQRFLNSSLIDSVTVEPRYSISKWWWSEDATEKNDDFREDVLKPHMTWIRDNVFSHDRISTVDGRPILQIWAAGQLATDYTYDRVIDEWGSYEQFVQDMRSLLRADGQEPFIVADTGWYGYGGYSGQRGPEMAKQFDSVSSFLAGGAWKLNEPNNYATQETALEYAEQNFQGHRKFAKEHNIEFIPMAYPGFNERGCSEARPEGRKTPRSPDFLRKTLELSEQYATSDMINLAPVNWLEGTQITPGTFMGNDYGTDYLEVVKEFQTPASK